MKNFCSFFLALFVLLIAGPRAAAQCTTEAPTITTGDFHACGYDYFAATSLGDEVLDADDVLRFVIHDGTGSQLGNILASYPTPYLAPLPPSLQLGVTYQVAAIAGNDNGSGEVDLADPCLSVAGGLSFHVVEPPEIGPITITPLTCMFPEFELMGTVLTQGLYTASWFNLSGFFVQGYTAFTNQTGEFFFHVSDNSTGCDDTVMVVVNPIPPIDVTISGNGLTCGDVITYPLTLTAEVTPAGTPVTYLWSNGATTPSIQANQPGSYCVTITSNQNGCNETACTTPGTGGGPLALEFHYVSNVFCFDSTVLSVIPTGGTAPYSYLWNNGVWWGGIFGPEPGTYEVTVTDGLGCTVSGSYVVEDDQFVCGSLEGTIFADMNSNCTLDPGEQGLGGFVLRLESTTGLEVFVYSYPDGTFHTPMNVGTYDVEAVLVNGVWISCQAVYTIDVLPNQTTVLNVPLQPAAICPVLTVDIGTNILRRCFENYFHITYCNQGTATAPDAYVDVQLDAFLTLDEAELPFTDLGNNLYRFELGDVAFNSCGTFWLLVTVSCDAVLGQTHCTTATIFPHDPCPAPNPLWSGASVRLTATCESGEVIFRIRNTGSGPTTVPLEYVVIEDAVMLMQGQITDPLASGDSVEVVFPANGATWRLEAEQEPFHPGFSAPSVALEGCTTGGNFSLGFVTQFSSDDADLWTDEDCIENVGAWDPNDKIGLPKGYGPEHYIRPGDALEYTIRFQNTGSDTAFNVVVRDTLSAWLDPATVVPGASSHPYRFEFYGEGGQMKFTFDNILLPDSNVNAAASQGFVSFRVSQRPGLPLESLIENRAGIFFDYNVPIITNTTAHRVGENFVTVGAWQPLQPGLALRLVPNPVADAALLELDGLPAGQEWVLELADLHGRLLRREAGEGSSRKIERGALPAGVYLLRVSSGGKLLGNAKMVVK